MIPDYKTLKLSYDYCSKLTKLHAKTFYFSSHFLPQDKKNACFAVYAFCRYIDDLIDNSLIKTLSSADGFSKIIEGVNEWRRQLKSLYNGEFIDHPIMIALKDTISKFEIPENLPNELIDGVFMDISKNRYSDFEDLKIYCYKVASVVGLMTTHIFGFKDKETNKHAIDLGIAMQMTNILRDIREDAGKNRIYIPEEEMRYFDYSEDDLFNFKINDNFHELMKYQIQRADSYYDKAEKGILMINKDCRITVGLMSRNYKNILTQIKKNNLNVYEKRAYVPYYRKLFNIPKVIYELKKSEINI